MEDIPDKIREMPSAKESEYALLGLILEQPVFIEKAIRWIQTPEAFWRTDNRKCWECMLELYTKGEKIDIITVSQLHRDKFNEIFNPSEILKVLPRSDHVETYARLIWLKYLQRTYNNTLQTISKKGYGTLDEFNEQVLETEHIIKYIREAQPTKFVPTEIILKDTLQHIQNKDDIIQFNIKVLDSFAYGMTRREMTVIGGRPSHGKTTLVVNIAKALIENGNKVMVFNREMSNIAMLTKILVLESSIPYTKMRKRDLTESEWKEIEETKERIQDKYKNLILYDSIRTLEEGIVEIRRHEPDVVIDDFIQLIKPPILNKDRRFQIEDILTEYKWTAKVQNIPIILLSQLSREVDKRMLDEYKPKMSDLAEAGTIEQLCENVIFVHRPYVHMPQTENPYKAEFIGAKVRYGEIGTYVVGFDGNACKFYDTFDEAIINRR